MLKDDPIVSTYPEFLPTPQELCKAMEMIAQPEHEELLRALETRISIAGCVESSMLRFCWQAKQDDEHDENCARAALQWVQVALESRQRLGMDTIFQGPFSPEFRDLYTSTVPFSFHKTDRFGHPVYITRFGAVDMEAFQSLWEMGELMQEAAGLTANGMVLFHLRAIEYLTRVVMARETLRQGRVVDRWLVIMDLDGIGLHHLDASLKAFLKSLSELSKLMFPEMMHATIALNVPWYLSLAGWPLVRPFLHPVTQAKVSVFYSESSGLAKLLEFLDEENIPPYLGGSCRCAECESGQLRGGSMFEWERSLEG